MQTRAMAKRADQDTPACPGVATPRLPLSPEERPIITFGSAMTAAGGYGPDEEEDYSCPRRPRAPSPPRGARGRQPDQPPEFQRGPPGFDGIPPGPPMPMPMGPASLGFKPEPYSGDGDWGEYLVAFEQFAMFMRWDDPTKATMLGFCLRGPARSVLAGLPPHRRIDYAALTEALTQNFSPREQLHLYQAELKSRQRQPGESMTALGRDIARLVRFAYPTADENTRETIGINAFLDALPGTALEVRLHVAKGRPTTLQQAIAYAMEVDAVMEAEARRGHAPRRGNVRMAGTSDDGTLEQLRVELQKALDQMRGEMEKKRQRADRPKEVTCYRCGLKGHIRKDCRVPEHKWKKQGNGPERPAKSQ